MTGNPPDVFAARTAADGAAFAAPVAEPSTATTAVPPAGHAPAASGCDCGIRTGSAFATFAVDTGTDRTPEPEPDGAAITTSGTDKTPARSASDTRTTSAERHRRRVLRMACLSPEPHRPIDVPQFRCRLLRSAVER